ncbi:MAG: hypothetical protein CVU05_04320 [Bacteroidetes bacterium HGW-Bacteroidetes-21]|nr:MAG: hypothetical protein CVU05_04320 [Bacteroidetes bacterium HGW-Bacteroidetes-21]
MKFSVDMKPAIKKKQAPQKPASNNKLLIWIILGVALLFTLVFRLRMLNLPLERDEGEYAYIASLILDGDSPFSAYNYKIPGVSFIYSFFMIFFGQGIAGVKAGLMVICLLNVWLFYKAFSRFIPSLAAAIGALFFSVMMSDFSVLGNAAHATHYVNLFSLLALYFAGKWITKPAPLLFLAGGAMAGLTFCMKQPAGLLIPFFGLLVFVPYLKGFLKQWKKVLLSSLLFVAGVALPLGLLALVVTLYNDWERFINWTFIYPSQYASLLSFEQGVGVFKMMFPMIVGAFTAWWIAALAGFIFFAREKSISSTTRWILGGFALFTFLTVVPGYYFRNHYFIVFLPVVAAFAGYSIFWVREKLSKMMGNLGGILGLAVLFLVFLFPVQSRSKLYFSMRPEKISREIYRGNPFADSKQVADFIKRQAKDNDQLAVFGSEAQMYYYSGLKAATGYMFTYEMVKKQPFAEKMQLEMIHEIEASKPRFYIFSNVNTSWLVEPGSPDTIFKWMDASIVENYLPIGVVDILDTRSVFIQDSTVLTYKPQSKNVMWIFKRKN